MKMKGLNLNFILNRDIGKFVIKHSFYELINVCNIGYYFGLGKLLLSFLNALQF